MTQSNPHLPNGEQIDAYLIGGLSADERETFEAHLNECSACAAALASARESDVALRNLLSDVRPPAGFEDRMIQATRRQAQRRMFIAPGIRRAAVAAAAIVAVSGVGYVGNRVMSDGLFNAVGRGQAIAASPARLSLGGGSAVVDRNSSPEAWDYGGGSNAAQKWVNFPKSANLSHSFESPDPNVAAHTGIDANGWKLNTSLPTDYGVASDINNGSDNLAADAEASLKKRVELSLSGALASDAKSESPSLPPVAFSFKPSESAWSDANGASLPGISVNKNGSDSPTLRGTNAYYMGRLVTSGKSYVDQSDTSLLQAEGGRIADVRQKDLYEKVPSQSPAAGSQIAMGNFAGDSGPNVTKPESDGDVKGQSQVTNTSPSGAAPGAPAPQPEAPADTRKVIRSGTMEFEVDSFDAALAQITKITNESGGFVSTTDSDKLPNGKVKGTVTLRVSPERLDVLVLSLRALGDLKSQQIKADDVSKQYNDLESSLAAAKAMEARLLDLIKSGNGQIKDLLAAEKELGVWREKIEQAEGEIRFYNNQISMSTLSITLYERDIKTAAVVTETETADTGIEAEDVEKARTEALKAIDDAKGRVIEAELKRFDAGQLAAHIVADVPPESSGAVIDRLKQIGRVARLEIHREQNAPEGADTSTATAPMRVERKPTRLVVSLYNLANVAPRRTTNITIAANDVEAAYEKLISQAKALGGRIVTSNLDHADPAQANGSIVFEVSPENVDAAQGAIVAQGDLLKRAVVENADTQNTTDSKYGFTVQVVSLASVTPREVIQQLAAATDVSAEYHTVLDSAIAAHARIRGAQLNEQDRQNVTGTLEFEVMRAQFDAVGKAIDSGGQIISREVSHSDAAQNTVDSKVMVRLMIKQADRLPPRETTTMEIQVGDAAKAAADAQASAIAAGGHVVDVKVNKDRAGRETATVVLSVPLGKSSELLDQLRSSGTVRSIDSSRDANAPGGAVARALINLTFATSDAIVANDTGLLSTIRNGLATSVAGLLWSVELLVIGLCLVGPWLVIAWIAWRLWRRSRKNTPPIVSGT